VKVSHVILRVTDMQRAVTFYEDAVGLEVLARSDLFAFLDAGSIHVALNIGDPPDPSTTTEIVLEVDDVIEGYHRMADRGVPFEIEPRVVTADGARELHAAHFRDPDGHLWSITGWVQGPA
jgi:catechol 2,3-dioxygenase-like lactoylglutathione lyase family enzyme